MVYKTAIAFGCVHRPVHSQEYCDWIIDQIKERQPDHVFLIGDLFDQKCVSRFAKMTASTLGEEFESADEFLSLVNDATPTLSKGRRVLLEGNHCSRIFREENAHLAKLLDFRRHCDSLRYWDTSRKYRPRPEDTIQFGQVTLAHGWACSNSGIRREAMSLGVPGGLYVHAHTHRGHAPVALRAGQNLQLPFYVANTGCGISSDEKYFQEWLINDWNRGYVWIEADPKKRDRNTPHWEADFVMHSTFWNDNP